MSTSSDVIVLITVVAGCAAATVIDLRSRRVPNALTLSMAAAGILIAASGTGRLSVAASLAGCLLGLILMLPGHLFGATGAGDVKLFAAAGTLLGPGAMVPAFVVTAIAGGVLALCVAASRGRVTRTCQATARLIASRGNSAAEIESMESNNRFAYAPAVAIGVTLAAIGW